MHLAILFILIFSYASIAKSNIDLKINQTNKKLKKFDKTYSKIDKNLAKTAKRIILEQKTILEQEKKLEQLQLELSLKEKKYQENTKKLQKLKSSQNKLKANQEKLRQNLAFMLAKNVSLSLILDDEKTKNENALITEEIFESLGKITKENISSLQKKFSSNSYKMKNIQKKINLLKQSIKNIDTKRKRVVRITQKKKENLITLQQQKNKYKASVKKLLKQQYSLKKTLAKLNIIKEDEKAKRIAREREKRRLALIEKRNKEALRNRAKPTNNLPKVKSRTDAYNSVKTKVYRGKKTIAPLDRYTVVKKFGPYEDPIYHIKIFNESISLKPKNSNAKVKNVLNGKVILAKKTSLLDNIVIIEHANGMHTIYAHLDKIAPTIKKGKRLKRGSIIGRVNNELMFEVTQRNYHINPLQLITHK